MYTITCFDEITLNSSGNPECSSGWTQKIISVPFDISQLTPEVVMSAFSAGFVLFATPYLASIGIKFMFSFLKN